MDLNEAIRDVVPLIGTEIRGQEVSLRLDLAPALPPVLGDRIQLQKVLINLVMNAAPGMRGGGHVAAEAVVIPVRVTPPT